MVDDKTLTVKYIKTAPDAQYRTKKSTSKKSLTQIGYLSWIIAKSRIGKNSRVLGAPFFIYPILLWVKNRQKRFYILEFWDKITKKSSIRNFKLRRSE